MKAIRNTLAYPFYFVAFVLHLLCALFTVIAQKVAGDESGPHGRIETISLVVFCCAAVSTAPLYVLSQPHSDLYIHKSQLVPQASMPYWRDVKTGFTPGQEIWAKPRIHLMACIFAESAVRNALEPAAVEFAPCGDGGNNNTTIDDDYFEATVTGIAKVNDKDRAFTVTLNHYPPSTGEWGFITTGLNIEPGETKVSCVAAQ